jgi:tetratricopeptide (TPR) repeat protein
LPLLALGGSDRVARKWPFRNAPPCSSKSPETALSGHDQEQFNSIGPCFSVVPSSFFRRRAPWTRTELTAVLQQAISFHRNGQLIEAETLYRKILAETPDCADALRLLGLVEFQKRNFEESLKLMDRSIKFHSGDAEHFYNRGIVLQALKRVFDALASYDKAIEFKPRFAEAHFNRGQVLQQLKRFQDALASYDQAISIKPDFAEAYSNRGTGLPSQLSSPRPSCAA